MIDCIDHVNIVVSDLPAATEFFSALGFQVQHQGDLEGEWVSKIVGLSNVQTRFVAMEIPGTETKLELIKYYSPASPKDEGIDLANKMGFHHVAFRVRNIDSVVSALKERDLEFLSEIQTYEPTQKRLVCFYGPDRILLELAQYGIPKDTSGNLLGT